MKLKMIAECTILEVQGSYHDETIAIEQSLKHLQTTIMLKLRKILPTIGLAKDKYKTIEPIDAAITPFNNLRQAVKKKFQRDAQEIKEFGLGSKSAAQAAEFWGFNLPQGYYDVQAGQRGRPTLGGTFDNYLTELVKKSKELPAESRIKLLDNFAAMLS